MKGRAIRCKADRSSRSRKQVLSGGSFRCSFTHSTFRGSPVCQRWGSRMYKVLTLWDVPHGSLLSPDSEGPEGGTERFLDPNSCPQGHTMVQSFRGRSYDLEGTEKGSKFLHPLKHCCQCPDILSYCQVTSLRTLPQRPPGGAA